MGEITLELKTTVRNSKRKDPKSMIFFLVILVKTFEKEI